MANSVDPEQTAPIGAVCSGSTLFASILNSSVMLGKYLQQTTSTDNIFRCIFFLGPLRVKASRYKRGFQPKSFFYFLNQTIRKTKNKETLVFHGIQANIECYLHVQQNMHTPVGHTNDGTWRSHPILTWILYLLCSNKKTPQNERVPLFLVLRIYVVSAQKNPLIQMVLFSTQNIYQDCGI